jgi:hypothetical protein
VNIHLTCRVCEHPGRIDLPGPGTWHCPGCDHQVQVPAAAAGEAVPCCLLCGNHEIYKKKDFPHWLGLTILTGACLASVVPYYLRYPSLTWAILIGSAVFDGVLYLCVGGVSVCYRCGAEYRGFPVNAEHKPFELSIAERYRQEKLRREQLRAAEKTQQR